MSWITPVTDRTQEDVDYALEMIAAGAWDESSVQYQAYAGDDFGVCGYAYATEQAGAECLKGALNKRDLRRICGNFDVLFARYAMDMEAPEVPDIPAEDFFAELEDCEWAIYEQSGIDVEPAAHPFNTYQLVNQLEALQLAAYEMLDTVVDPIAGDDVYMSDDTTTILI